MYGDGAIASRILSGCGIPILFHIVWFGKASHCGWAFYSRSIFLVEYTLNRPLIRS